MKFQLARKRGWEACSHHKMYHVGRVQLYFLFRPHKIKTFRWAQSSNRTAHTKRTNKKIRTATSILGEPCVGAKTHNLISQPSSCTITWTASAGTTLLVTPIYKKSVATIVQCPVSPVARNNKNPTATISWCNWKKSKRLTARFDNFINKWKLLIGSWLPGMSLNRKTSTSQNILLNN